jgi:hypothetical protein
MFGHNGLNQPFPLIDLTIPLVNQAYADVRRMERKAEIAENLKSIESQKAKTLQGVYDVIVLDPPWRMQKMGAH